MIDFKLPFLFLIAFLVGADEFLLGPILTPIGTDLGVMPERVTLFITAYALPLALLAPAFGFLSDRHGRLAVLLPSTAMFALASILTGFVTSFEWGIATRVLTGIASAGMLPIAFALAADESEDAAKSISFVMGGLTTGLMAGPGLGAYLTELWSWRTAFISLGPPHVRQKLAFGSDYVVQGKLDASPTPLNDHRGFWWMAQDVSGSALTEAQKGVAERLKHCTLTLTAPKDYRPHLTFARVVYGAEVMPVNPLPSAIAIGQKAKFALALGRSSANRQLNDILYTVDDRVTHGPRHQTPAASVGNAWYFL